MTDDYDKMARKISDDWTCCDDDESSMRRVIIAALRSAAEEARAVAFEQCARIVEKRYREDDADSLDSSEYVTRHCAKLIRAARDKR